MLTPELASLFIERLQSESVTLFEMQERGGTLKLKFARGTVGPAPHPVAPAIPVKQEVAAYETSPGMGHISFQHPLLLNGMPEVGDAVAKGALLAMLVVDGVLTPIEASRDGVLAKLLVSDGQLVGYGSPLIEWA